jgi:hypothetical protein
MERKPGLAMKQKRTSVLISYEIVLLLLAEKTQKNQLQNFIVEDSFLEDKISRRENLEIYTRIFFIKQIKRRQCLRTKFKISMKEN